jgi:hypothetical protein
MLHLIQDEIIKRALDFFGLRGVVQHGYEATVLPVIQIGDLGQRTLSLQSTTSVAAPFANCPTGKVWRPIAFSGRITQTGGTVGITLSFAIGGLGNSGLLLPFQSAPSGTADNNPPSLKKTFTLNTVNDVTIVFPQDLLIPAGNSLFGILAAGDGTITLSSGSPFLVHELGEGLLALQ